MNNTSYKRYPATIISLIIASIMAAYLIGVIGKKAVWPERLEMFFWVFSIGALFSEEIFNKRIQCKLIGLTVAACIAGCYVSVLSHESEILFNIKKNYVDGYMGYFVLTYAVMSILACIYHMYKHSGLEFEDYIMYSFWSLIKTIAIYVIVAVAAGIIVFMFNIMILDANVLGLVYRIEVVLAGGVLLPLIIHAFFNAKLETSVFEAKVVKFVMLPILVLLLLMVYIYVISFIFTKHIPSNQLFKIVSCVMAYGMLEWTMVMSMEGTVSAKIAEKLPYFSMPIVLLQILALYIRISQYGVTPKRYIGCAIVVFECAYFVLYSIKQHKYVKYIIMFLIAEIMVVLVIPYVNVYSVSTRSQAARLQVYLEKGIGSLNKKELAKAQSVYQSLRYDCGVEGLEYVTELNIRSSDVIMLNAYWSRNEVLDYEWYYTSDTCYDMDTEGYSRICKARVKVSMKDLSDGDMSQLGFEVKQDNAKSDREEVINIDMTAIVEKFMQEYVVNGNEANFLRDNNPFLLEDGTKLYLTGMSIKTKDMKLKYLDVEGYILQANE